MKYTEVVHVRHIQTLYHRTEESAYWASVFYDQMPQRAQDSEKKILTITSPNLFKGFEIKVKATMIYATKNLVYISMFCKHGKCKQVYVHLT